jgi:Kef-type K+ transport system membrane component KefB
MILSILKILLAVVTAFVIGKLVAKLKLPSILGWLIAGMILGPHALGVMGNEILDAKWYQIGINVLECAVGLMIGTELVWNRIKKSGKSIIITTFTQSLGAFLIVSAVFGLVFHFTGIPVYLAFIFGAIALATAPAPALSIVKEFNTSGPVTSALIPMAALDDIIGVIIFFTTITIVSGTLSGQKMNISMIALIVLLPIVIGAITGLPAGLLLKKKHSKGMTLTILISLILVTAGIGYFCNNYLVSEPILNFMLMGMSFSAVFSNMVSEERLEEILEDFNPILGISMIFVILNLGAPLDYHLILGAGLYTVIYIAARAFGKYFGARFGATVTKAPETVQKYLGLTLLPHSGVSLVFTGIAVSALSGPAPEYAKIIQGTIAAAAVINEVIAVVVAKKGFEWAGELSEEEGATVLHVS